MRAPHMVLPCPFCGGEPLLWSWRSSVTGTELFEVDCKECECGTPSVLSPEEAAKLWNARAHASGVAFLAHKERSE